MHGEDNNMEKRTSSGEEPEPTVGQNKLFVLTTVQSRQEYRMIASLFLLQQKPRNK